MTSPVGLTFVLQLAMQRIFPDEYATSATGTVSGWLVANIVVSFAFVCLEPLRDLAGWIYNTLRNTFLARTAGNEPDDLSIS